MGGGGGSERAGTGETWPEPLYSCAGGARTVDSCLCDYSISAMAHLSVVASRMTSRDHPISGHLVKMLVRIILKRGS